MIIWQSFNYSLTWNGDSQRLSADASHESDCSSVLADKITGSVPPLGLFAELLPDVSALICFFPLYSKFGPFSSEEQRFRRASVTKKHTSVRPSVRHFCLMVCLFVLLKHRLKHKWMNEWMKMAGWWKRQSVIGNVCRARGKTPTFPVGWILNSSTGTTEVIHGEGNDSLLIPSDSVCATCRKAHTRFFFLVNTIFPSFFFSIKVVAGKCTIRCR